METGKPNLKRKVYYYADLYSDPVSWQDGIVFIGQDGSRMYRWGWTKEKVNNTLEKLIATHWVDKWSEIYREYNQALLDVATDPTTRKFPKCCLTLWREDYEWWYNKTKFKKSLSKDDTTPSN